jgi:hypothetical protein
MRRILVEKERETEDVAPKTRQSFLGYWKERERSQFR